MLSRHLRPPLPPRGAIPSSRPPPRPSAASESAASAGQQRPNRTGWESGVRTQRRSPASRRPTAPAPRRLVGPSRWLLCRPPSQPTEVARTGNWQHRTRRSGRRHRRPCAKRPTTAPSLRSPTVPLPVANRARSRDRCRDRGDRRPRPVHQAPSTRPLGARADRRTGCPVVFPGRFAGRIRRTTTGTGCRRDIRCRDAFARIGDRQIQFESRAEPTTCEKQGQRCQFATTNAFTFGNRCTKGEPDCVPHHVRAIQ